MTDESNLRFRFTQSPSGGISGIAFGEKGEIVASFRLEVGRGSVYMRGKSWRSVTLTMVSTELGAKVYDIFDEILSRHGERDTWYKTWTVGRTRCRWRMRDDEVKTAIKKVKKALEKRKNRNSSTRALG